MPARPPRPPRTRDQVVAFDAKTDESKERMISELARLQGDAGTRLGSAEARLAQLAEQPRVTGSRGGNAALASLLSALAELGLITDETTP